MNTEIQRGFTVIEVVLFLGISSILFVALMVGVGTNIAQQRYREGVYNFSAFLQDQYVEVDNTRNGREDTTTCVGGNFSENPSTSISRGTSECVLLGKAIEMGSSGTIMHTYSVIGTEPANIAPGDGELDIIKKYLPKTSNFAQEEKELDWQVVVTNNPEFSMLILRSPANGLLRIFTSSNALPSDLRTMVTPSLASSPSINTAGILRLCVDGDRGALPTFSVNIDSRIASQDGVTVNEADSACA